MPPIQSGNNALSKADRERQRLVAEKCQSLIEVLLKDEDNKYCVDCDAKGPRWASWNLGVFLCIRCVGMHRNLGVHISRAKSVNLDAWTPEQVAYMQRMGNRRARAIYEANLPDDFRRPQTDTALESFIRAKYEHKKYISQEYVDPGPPAPAFNIDDEIKRMKEMKRNKVSSAASTRMISIADIPTNPKPRPVESLSLKSKVKTTPGLVDLETVVATEAASKSTKNTLDLLDGFGGESSVAQTEPSANSAVQTVTDSLDILSIGSTASNNNISTNATKTATPSSQNIFDLDILTGSPVTQPNSANQTNSILDLDFLTSTQPTQTQNSSGQQLIAGLQHSQVSAVNNHNLFDLDFSNNSNSKQPASTEKKPLTKESILSLYSLSPNPAAAASDPFGLNNSRPSR